MARGEAAAEEASDREDQGIVVEAPLYRRRTRGWEISREPIVAPPAPAPRPLAVARMLAMAHEIVRLIDEGAFVDQADAACALGFTRARMSQIIDLTLLAPAIQEEILFAEVGAGRDPVTERGLRRVAATRLWAEQPRPTPSRRSILDARGPEDRVA